MFATLCYQLAIFKPIKLAELSETGLLIPLSITEGGVWIGHSWKPSRPWNFSWPPAMIMGSIEGELMLRQQEGKLILPVKNHAARKACGQ